MYGLWVYSVKTWFEINIFSAQENSCANSLRNFKSQLEASQVSILKFQGDCLFPALSMFGCCRALYCGR